MKLPTAGGIVTVFGNQEEARRCEDNASIGNTNVHVIETPNEDNEAASSEEPEKSGGVSPAEHAKKVPLCEDVPDRMVIIEKGSKRLKKPGLYSFSAIIKTYLLGPLRTCEGSVERSSRMSSG